MSDVRISRLEESVALLREEKASLVTSVEHLTDAVRELKTTVEALSASMNKGKGALWVIVGASSVLGGLLTVGISKLLGSGS